MLRIRSDAGEVVKLLLGERSRDLAQYQINGAFDRRERRPELVGDVRDKVRFHSVQLLQPLVGESKLVGSLFDLFLQLAISLAQIPRHFVELFREHFDLISCFQLQACTHVPAADTLDPTSQRFQWPNDPPGNKQGGNQRHAKAYEQETGSSKQRCIERAIYFFNRLFNEDCPAECRYRRPGAKNPPGMEILGDGPRRACRNGSGLESRTHLIEMSYVEALQYNADFRVRDEIAIACYGISITFGSDF